MKTQTCLIAVTTLTMGVPLVLGQSAHYPNGVEGLKGASLPPPGIYLRDYNYLYLADEFPGGPGDFDLTAYVQAPRLIWISEFKVLGGSYGADVLVPLVYQDVNVGPAHWDKFGLGDVFIEPATLSWHSQRYDIGVGYGVWAPTGDFDETEPASPGKGFWGHMLTAGATLYLDKAKSWAFSALNRYEINHEVDYQHAGGSLTPGNVWTLEAGLNKTFNQTLDVGVVGYLQLQTTQDSGSNAASDRDEVVGVGPEVNYFMPKHMFFVSARYLYEVEANNRPQGHLFNITLTKGF